MQAEIFEILKSVLRARRMTYAELGKQLDTSEPTIKRLFASRDCKISRLSEICAILDLSLDDVVAQASRVEITPRSLGDRIEAQLADDLPAFHLYLLLTDGVGIDRIMDHCGLTPDDVFRIGCRLERMELVRVLPHGRLKLADEGPMKLRRDGPLHGALLKINLEFLQRVFARPDSDDAGFITQSRRISQATARHMMTELHRLSRQLSDMARQDQLTVQGHDLQTYKMTLAWAPVALEHLVKVDAPSKPPVEHVSRSAN